MANELNSKEVCNQENHVGGKPQSSIIIVGIYCYKGTSVRKLKPDQVSVDLDEAVV